MITTLPPYPAYKDSGVPWLGKVPEHWEVLPFKRYFTGRWGRQFLHPTFRITANTQCLAQRKGTAILGEYPLLGLSCILVT